jgi:hypothetical protein
MTLSEVEGCLGSKNEVPIILRLGGQNNSRLAQERIGTT